MMTVVIIGFVLVILSMWRISSGIQEIEKQLWDIHMLMSRRWSEEIRNVENEEVD